MPNPSSPPPITKEAYIAQTKDLMETFVSTVGAWGSDITADHPKLKAITTAEQLRKELPPKEVALLGDDGIEKVSQILSKGFADARAVLATDSLGQRLSRAIDFERNLISKEVRQSLTKLALGPNAPAVISPLEFTHTPVRSPGPCR